MTQNKKIIIIGAGLAGLAAANKLLGEKIDVRVLEARDRVGGRTWTNENMGVPIDEGAFVIHGIENNPVTRIADIVHAKYFPIKMENIYFPEESSQLSNEQLDEIDALFQQLLLDAHQYAMEQDADIPLNDAITAVFDQLKYPLLTPQILGWRKLFLEHYTGSNVNKLSARHWQDDEIMLGGGNHVLVSGYKSIVMELAKNVPVELDTIVNEIHYSSNGVTVKTSRGEIEADAVIVTLPLGVLKAKPDMFHPPLPPHKKQSLDRLQMGVLDKIVLQFDKPFWPDNYRIISFLRETYSEIDWFLNYSLLCHAPILIGFVSGEVARRYENMSDDAVKNEAMKMLRSAFGNETPGPVAFFMTRWNNDPYSLGSYSHIPVHASGSDYDKLAEPILKRLYFAGEATNKHFPGTAHGAIFSGLRAASEAIID